MQIVYAKSATPSLGGICCSALALVMWGHGFWPLSFNLQTSTMQNCELVDVLTQPDWVIAIARVAIRQLSSDERASGLAPDYVYSDALAHDCDGSGSHLYGYRCWVFTPEFTVLDDGEVHPSREAAAASARRLVMDSREF